MMLAVIASIGASLVLAVTVDHFDVSRHEPTETRIETAQLTRVPLPTEVNDSGRAHRADTMDPPRIEQPPDERGLHLVNSPVTFHMRGRSNTIVHRW
jgi:hypothetical protein